MSGRRSSKDYNRRDHRTKRQEKSGNYRFVRRGDNNFHDRRRNFHNRGKPFSRPFKRRGKLTHEKLNDELDNYFEHKGGEGFKDYLDNDLETYKKNAKMNENLQKENISLPPQQTEEKKIDAPPAEVKEEKEKVEEVQKEAENKEEVEEEKKEDKKKKKRGKK